MPDPDPESYVSIADICRRWSVSRYPIHARIQSGELPARTMGTGRNAVIRVKLADAEKLFVPVVPNPGRGAHHRDPAQDDPEDDEECARQTDSHGRPSSAPLAMRAET